MISEQQTLLRFIKAGLIPLGGDDTKLGKLRETAADIAAALKKTPVQALQSALIVVDPAAPADDPAIKQALDALEKKWPTYANLFSGTPILVLRAVLLDALVQAASSDDRLGVVLVMCTRNLIPFAEAANEQPIWAEIVSEIEQRIDARAEAEWATPGTIKVQTSGFNSLDGLKIDMPSVNFDKAGHQAKIENAVTNNPVNNVAAWAPQFGPRLAQAISDALDFVAHDGRTPVDLSRPLKILAQAVSDHVDRTLVAVSAATAGLQRRTNLIWWKQTLYSPSARAAYRSMPIFTAATAMAFDLHNQVPTFSPASVSAFLEEAVLALPSIDPAQARPVQDLVTEASGANELSSLRETIRKQLHEPVGHRLLLSLISHDAGRSSLDQRAFRSLVGVAASTPITAPKWALWIFRELQAIRAVQEAGNPVK